MVTKYILDKIFSKYFVLNEKSLLFTGFGGINKLEIPIQTPLCECNGLQ